MIAAYKGVYHVKELKMNYRSTGSLLIFNLYKAIGFCNYKIYVTVLPLSIWIRKLPSITSGTKHNDERLACFMFTLFWVISSSV